MKTDVKVGVKMKKVSAFGEEIKRIRKSRGLSIRVLSEKSGVSHSYISQIENGNRDTPQPELIKKIATGLGVDYFALMRIAGFMTPDRKESDDISELLITLPIEYKKQFIVEKKENIPCPDDNEPYINKATLRSDIKRFQSKLEYMVHDKFIFLLALHGTAGDFLKILRLHKNKDITEMAKHLNTDSKTYKSLEENLKSNSALLKEYGEKLGEILGVENFEDWLELVASALMKILPVSTIVGAHTKSDLEIIEISVPSVYQKTDENGIGYYITYTEEELKRNLFNLDNILNQEVHDVLYKDKVLSKSEIEKVKTMLKLLLEDD
ncbi:helix-turn-helix domain-containing protein [Peribacillus sp. NPDC096447]|uniref:helix-turn-helix domain-containing protein n=1 Tax=Peribacillus sp. NPDC096447 TaxID=3364394 RepID=UPI00382E1654